MEIVYFSLTGNIKRFLEKTGLITQAQAITPHLVISKPYMLITSTLGFGEIPEDVKHFLNHPTNQANIKYVIGSGNKNWGIYYANAAKLIAKQYNIPNLFNFELAGNQEDINKFLDIYQAINKE